MHSRKQLAYVISQIINGNLEDKIIDDAIIDDYKKLNDKCDNIIDKNKRRKNKTTNNVGD